MNWLFKRSIIRCCEQCFIVKKLSSWKKTLIMQTNKTWSCSCGCLEPCSRLRFYKWKPQPLQLLIFCSCLCTRSHILCAHTCLSSLLYSTPSPEALSSQPTRNIQEVVSDTHSLLSLGNYPLTCERSARWKADDTGKLKTTIWQIWQVWGNNKLFDLMILFVKVNRWSTELILANCQYVIGMNLWRSHWSK